ncbi:acyloxyacyl hydrolase [Thalassomonas actiniarum]|uniref:Acyloxyacyl hydrolase n=1 Tax=Thalassomonas actiniarum TaxID=485447 RepID=A0AAF0C2Z8_9GAMM|nr:acyloxyacyl hydrolase [Thalassomonas actiniarum]WDD99067.1 acyloxyacyl hydrolase [Thalassomonas actiniarum]
MSLNKSLNQCFFLFAIYCFSSVPAYADNHGGTFGLHFYNGKETGNSDPMQRYTLTWSFDKKWLESDNGYLTGRWELSHTRWELYLQEDNTGWALNPVFRYVIPANRFTDVKNVYYFFDAGIGVIKLDHRGFEQRDLGSKWLFEDKLAAGIGFGKHYELALSWVHYSNANLAGVNDGASMFAVNYALTF